MTSTPVTPLNYVDEAIRDLKQVETQLRPVAPLSAKALSEIVKMLAVCERFVLPNACKFINEDDLGQIHLDLARLPSSCMAFEAPWDLPSDGYDNLAGFAQVQATKRIALCWDMQPEYEFFTDLYSSLRFKYPDGGTLILPIFKTIDSDTWSFGLGCSFLPYKNILHTPKETDDTPFSTIISSMGMFEAGLAKPGTQHFFCEPVAILPELFESAVIQESGDHERVLACITLDSRDEVLMFIQACSALRCNNVTTGSLDKKNTCKFIKSVHEKEMLHLAAGDVSALGDSYVWVFR